MEKSNFDKLKTFLKNRKGKFTKGDLARHLNIDTNTITNYLNVLKEEDLLEELKLSTTSYYGLRGVF